MKHWKAIVYCVLMGAFLVTSVLGWWWTEKAKQPFWWTFWVVAAIVSIPAFIGGIYWFGKSRNKW